MAEKIDYITTIINKLVFEWTTKFYYSTDFLGKENGAYEFVTEFSLPTQLRPTPEARVKVYFFVREKEDSQFDIKFRFENQSLIHSPDNTIRLFKIEQWIERLLKEKSITRSVLFLGTEFEAGRLNDPRLQNLISDGTDMHVVKDIKRINESLMNSMDMNTSTISSLDDKTLDILKKSLYELFRAIDKQNIGVVSYQECKEVLKSMHVELTDVELSSLLSLADKKNSGMVEYKEFISLGAEIIHGLLIKQQTEQKLSQEDELYLNQACWTLFNDQILETGKKIEQLCRKADEDKNNWVNFSTLREIIYAECRSILSEKEIDILLRIIKSKHEDNFPYEGFRDLLFKHKVEILKNGFMESNLNKLENYLIKLFESYDNDKTGKISTLQFIEALSKADKIIYTKTQLIILRSFVEKAKDGMIEYKKQARLIGEITKKLFSPSTLKKQAQIIEKGIIKEDEKINGYTEDDIINALDNILNDYDCDKNYQENKEFWVKCLKKSNLEFLDEEIATALEDSSMIKEKFKTKKEFKEKFYQLLKLIRRNKALFKLSKLIQ